MFSKVGGTTANVVGVVALGSLGSYYCPDILGSSPVGSDMSDAIHLANSVLMMDLRSEQGMKVNALAYRVLDQVDPGNMLSKHYMIQEILENSNMPKLEDLRKSLLTMSPDELRAKIREIRADRIIRKEAPKKKVERAKAKDKTQMDLRELMASMSDEEREAFLQELEG